MRILFVSPPGHGHLFPVVPAAWALRSAGHEVLVASVGWGTTIATQAGLSAADTAPGADLMAVFRASAGAFRPEQWKAPAEGQAPSEEQPPRSGGHPLFCKLGELMADGTVALAEQWRPDVIVQSPLGVTASLAGGKLGIPVVMHAFGLSTNWSWLDDMVYRPLEEVFARHGVTEVPTPAGVVDVAPASMRVGPPGDLPMQYVPFNGSGTLPEWALRRSGRPRIAVTLGTVAPQVTGLSPLQWIIDAAREIDAEFILALGNVDASTLGKLPENVIAAGWVPLDALLATSAAVIHHGGSGTTMTALAAGVPQLVLPQGADQFYNADSVVKRGVGIAPAAEAQNAATIGALLEDAAIRSATTEVQAEIRAMPLPWKTAPKIAALG